VRSAKCVGTLRNLLGSATIAGVSGILARAQLAVFHQTRTADVAARRNDGRGRLQCGNASLGRTLLPEYPDITLYIEHLRSRISNEPLEEVRFASPFFLRSVDVPIGATKGKRVVELRRLGKRIVFALEDDLFLVLHLMIAGRLRWRPRGTKPVGKIALATFEFPKGTLLVTGEAADRTRRGVPGNWCCSQPVLPFLWQCHGSIGRAQSGSRMRRTIT